MTISAHCVVKNEERWIWYCLNSVLEHVDELLVWDTGSTDNTVDIIKSITSPKIKFLQAQSTTSETDLSLVRSLMLKNTTSDWIMILDGDEIWPDESIKKVIAHLDSNPDILSVVVPTLNCVGDVFHIAPEYLGKYHLASRQGHLNLRFINLKKSPGLYVSNDPGKFQSYFQSDGSKIEDQVQKMIFVDAPYLHMTHLIRSKNHSLDSEAFWRKNKLKFELGNKISKDFIYPSCFYIPNPYSTPWQRRSRGFLTTAFWQTPLRFIKNI